MSSIQELTIKILKLKEQYNMTRNENDKLTILKQLEETKKELDAKKLNAVSNKEVKEEPKKPEVKKEPEVNTTVNNTSDEMNRGKVSEPGSNIPDSKQDDKRDNRNNKNNRK